MRRTRPSLRHISICLIFLFHTLAGCAEEQVAAAPLKTLIVRTAERDIRYRVEIADDDASRTRGLMDRKYLPEDQGMLFDFHADEQLSFWMKNTYIPLDMLFIDGRGVIRRIVPNTEPLSTRAIPSGQPARYVLELNARQAERQNIKVGDSILPPE
ncbi:MAG: DUF192 domain-containing protein [Gammaproteobacteria bacterium]|nr:MAG: DUF192 domain-containing protein [Gammaproteobacteria bacterium]